MKTYQLYLLVALMQIAGANAESIRLQLDSMSVSTLRNYSGEKVILAGYLCHEHGWSILSPSEQESKSFNYQHAVWVEIANREKWKFLWTPFHGGVEVEGFLRADPKKRYGHLGAFDAELTDARVHGVPSRLLGVIAAITGALLLFSVGLKTVLPKR